MNMRLMSSRIGAVAAVAAVAVLVVTGACAPAPVGSAGSADPQGGGRLVDVVTNSGYGLNPGTNLDVIGVHATVDVPAGGTVLVNATKVIGTLGLDVPAALDAWVCHRPAGSARTSLVTVGPAHNIQAWSRARTPLTLAAAIEGLPAGSHEVGLCAQATSLRWNDNHRSSVTATVFAP